MNTKQTQQTLQEEKQRLEDQQPEIASSYRNFLDSYQKYNRMKAQFDSKEAGETKPQTQFRATR